MSAANLQSNTQYNVYVVANGNNALAPLSTTVTTHAAQLSDQAVVAVDGHSIQVSDSSLTGPLTPPGGGTSRALSQAAAAVCS